MWIFIFFLITLFPYSLFASEDFLLMGEVIEVNLERREVTISIKDDCHKNMEFIEKGIAKSGDKVTISVEKEEILEKIQQGEYIRVWVNYDSNKKDLIANTITAPGRFIGGKDQTGIRRRLEKMESTEGGFGRRRHGR